MQVQEQQGKRRAAPVRCGGEGLEGQGGRSQHNQLLALQQARFLSGSEDTDFRGSHMRPGCGAHVEKSLEGAPGHDPGSGAEYPHGLPAPLQDHPCQDPGAQPHPQRSTGSASSDPEPSHPIASGKMVKGSYSPTQEPRSQLPQLRGGSVCLEHGSRCWCKRGDRSPRSTQLRMAVVSTDPCSPDLTSFPHESQMQK